MTLQYVYRSTMIKPRGVRTVARAIYQPQIDLLAAQFPPSNSHKNAIAAETKVYQGFIITDLACNWDHAARPKAD